MPQRMRMIDEETLRDKIRENPKSTRWVSKRGLVRKKQGGGKGKGDAVDEGQARKMHARDGYEREKHRREMSEIDALARKMHAREMSEREKHQRLMSEIDVLARKMHARDMSEREKHQRQMSEIDVLARKMHARTMHDRQVHTQELYESEKRERETLESEKLERDLRAQEMHAREMHDGQTHGRGYERQMDERDMPERGRRNHHPSDHGRRSDPHHHADYEDDYHLPHQPHRGARPSRRRSYHDDDENDPEVLFAPLRRLRPPNPSFRQPANRNRGPYDTGLPAPNSQSARLPPKPQR